MDPFVTSQCVYTGDELHPPRLSPALLPPQASSYRDGTGPCSSYSMNVVRPGCSACGACWDALKGARTRTVLSLLPFGSRYLRGPEEPSQSPAARPGDELGAAMLWGWWGSSREPGPGLPLISSRDKPAEASAEPTARQTPAGLRAQPQLFAQTWHEANQHVSKLH